MPKETLAIWAYSFKNIPLLYQVRPQLIKLDDNDIIVKIPLRFGTRNHLKTMYFGALAIGADLTAGALAFFLIRKSKKKVSLLFKDVKGEFLKRIEGDAYFYSSQGQQISAMVEKTLATGERVEEKILMEVKVPDKLGDEVAARFEMTLSLKAT